MGCLLVVMFGEVAVEGGAGNAECGGYMLDGLVGGQRCAGGGELVEVGFAGSAGLFAVGGSDVAGVGGAFAMKTRSMWANSASSATASSAIGELSVVSIGRGL